MTAAQEEPEVQRSSAVGCMVRPGDPRGVEGVNCTPTRRTDHARQEHMGLIHLTDFDFAEVVWPYSAAGGRH